MRLKIIIAAVVLSLGIGFLAYAGMRKAQVYYLEVDAYLADSQFHGQRVRLCGSVGQEGFETNRATMTVRFNLLGREGKIPVVYEGLAPEMFKAGADVVAEGRQDETGVFRATQLMTKCASKYRPADYPARPGHPQ
jgi:cytochrome c-type biogenesis protein CcmE